MMTRYEEYLERKMKESSFKGVSIPPRKALQPHPKTDALIQKYNNYEVSDEDLERHYNTFYMLEEVEGDF